MKKLLGLLATTCFIVLLIVGCSSDDNAGGETTNNDNNSTTETNNTPDDATDVDSEIGEIVVVTPAAEHGWLAGVIYFAEEAGRELGLDNFRVLTSSNVAEQSAQLDDLIAQGVGAIVLQPHTYELELAAERVIDAQIPLIVFNRYVNVDYDAYVAGSNFMMGAESAQKIGEGLNGEGIVITLANPSAGSTSAVRNEGFRSVMDVDFPNIELIEMTVDNFTQEAALSAMADVLVANPHIDAIFSIDDESSLGFLQAIREAGRTEIQFMSGGGGAQTYFREIYQEDGIVLFTVTYSPRMMGDSIRVAHRILSGGAISELDSSNQWIIPPSIITSDNVANYFADDSPY